LGRFLVGRQLAAGLRSAAAVALFLEYEAVLTRPEHLAKAGITVVEAEIVLDVLAAVTEPVERRFLWRPGLRDADDDMVLEAAVNRRAAEGNARRADFAGFHHLMASRGVGAARLSVHVGAAADSQNFNDRRARAALSDW
jgi:hypothetical protein